MNWLVWSERSLRDLEAIQDFVTRDSPVYASLVVQRLIRAPERLREFPESGRIVPERGDPRLRELIIRPFRLVYRIRDSSIEIVTVFRATRLLPEEL